MKSIKTKKDFVRRYQRGEFGNMPLTWDSLEEFRASVYPNLVHLRNRVAGGRTWYNIHPRHVGVVWQVAARQYGASNLYISEMGPGDKYRSLQGEVQQSEQHLTLTYTFLQKPLRTALLEDLHTTHGVNATQLLRRHMDASSWDWLNILLNEYPYHVIEFSTYTKYWGTLPRHNTLFWEVRDY